MAIGKISSVQRYKIESKTGSLNEKIILRCSNMYSMTSNASMTGTTSSFSIGNIPGINNPTIYTMQKIITAIMKKTQKRRFAEEMNSFCPDTYEIPDVTANLNAVKDTTTARTAGYPAGTAWVPYTRKADTGSMNTIDAGSPYLTPAEVS